MLKILINNYDKIANHYDILSRLIFGKSQVIAQVNQLKNIPENSFILIVGGGTGWILEEIAKIHSKGLKIMYVEISGNMIELSRGRNYGQNEVDFIHSAIEEFNTGQSIDVILTPFLFDNFSPGRCQTVFQKLNPLLNDGGLWFFIDFTSHSKTGSWWKKLFLKVMYQFFSFISDVEANKLVDMTSYFDEAGYKVLEEKFYYNQFIKAIVYQK